MPKTGKLFEEFVATIARLRHPKKGCPWDLKQTHDSLKPYLIEETYEVLDAIDQRKKGKGIQKLREELGDVLLQVVLHSQLGKEDRNFSIDDVLRAVNKKIVERHPHVFSNVKVSSVEEVTKNWEQIKRKKDKRSKSVVDGLPSGMPALLKCHRIGEKVARVGFDWTDVKGVREKVLEELNEFLEADGKPQRDAAHVREEFGDMLFTLAQLAKKMGLNAEDLLIQANNKFCQRFQGMERLSKGRIDKMSPRQLQELWQKVKKSEKKATKKNRR